MQNPDDLFRAENVDEQIEHLIRMQEPWQQSTPGALTIAALQSIYEEDEDILQGAWSRLSGLHNALDVPGTPAPAIDRSEHREKEMPQKTTVPFGTNNTTLRSTPQGSHASRYSFHPRRRWWAGFALVAAVLLILIDIVAWKVLMPRALPAKQPVSGGAVTPTITICRLRSGGTMTVSTPVNASGMKTYSSKEYSLLYPQTWQGQEDTQGSGNGARFDNEAIGASLVIDEAGSGGSISPATIANGALPFFSHGTTVKQFHPIETPKTVVVGGVVWEQRAGIGDFTRNGQTVGTKQVALVTYVPGSCSTAFIIHYQAPTTSFDQTNVSAFQPMLQSFTFVR